MTQGKCGRVNQKYNFLIRRKPMTDYILADEQRKRLTEFLDECWHHWKVAFPQEGVTDYDMRGHKCRCGMYWPVFRTDGPIIKRTFSTPTDAHDLAKKLVNSGKWGIFRHWVYNSYEIPNEYFNEGNDEYSNFDSDFDRWLFAEPESPARFCWLANSFLEEKNNE
jgi:hypothetical protein